jgi:predicted kinase
MAGGVRAVKVDHAHLVALVPAPGGAIAWDAVLAALPALAELATVPQDPIHHAEGDVLTHTKLVGAALVELAAYRDASAERRLVLFLAAALHDLAKATCTRTDDAGRVTSPGHSTRGAIDARVLLWRAGVPLPLRERICRIIRHHQLPFFAIKGTRDGRSAEYLARTLSHELSLLELTAVAEADIRGRRAPDVPAILDDIELFREVARDEGCLDAPRPFADDHTRFTYVHGGGAIAPDYPFFQPPGSKVIVMSGLPASGKNTWVAAHGGGLPVISYDDAREELGLAHGDDMGAAVHLAVDRAKELLRRRAPFVWNATHLSTQMRGKALALLQRYDAEVEIVYTECGERELKRRNAARDTTLTYAGIERMLGRWEVPVPGEAHRVRYVISG